MFLLANSNAVTYATGQEDSRTMQTTTSQIVKKRKYHYIAASLESPSFQGLLDKALPFSLAVLNLPSEVLPSNIFILLVVIGKIKQILKTIFVACK